MNDEARTDRREPGARRLALVGKWTAAFWLALLGALLITLLYQIPARHSVDVGGYDAAYVQGFHDPAFTANPADPALIGSDGTARWSRASSALLFPQSGLPAQVTVRLRGWRLESAPPRVRIMLNGREELAAFSTTGDWEEHSFAIHGGVLKASDFFVEIQSDTVTLPDDGRVVGVLVDHITYVVAPGGPIAPYPSQVAYGALAGALLALLAWSPAVDVRRRRLRAAFWTFLGIGLLFLFLYRLQPPLYPYPLRWLLPLIDLGLAAALTIRDGPSLVARRPAWCTILAAAALAIWLGAVWLAARDHLTLSRPGVENDFRVFAIRSASLESVFLADGFYNLGYPLLLWLAHPLTDGNPFLAGRLVAALSGGVLLASGVWLARSLSGGGVWLAGVGLALSPLVVQYALYLGTDMPFAACTALALAALVAATRARRRLWLIGVAGFVGGCAFLMRHLGLALLVWGVIHCVWLAPPAPDRRRFPIDLRGLLAYGLGALLAVSPQLAINTAQVGEPLYNQQAKNVWLAVYADVDWGRWYEAPDTIMLTDVVLSDPARFFDNWRRNLIGFVGGGAEDTSEFGRAIQLRLLGWPMNWLAVVGLLGWLGLAIRDWRDGRNRLAVEHRLRLSLLLFIGIYALAVSMAFTLQRFFLPLTPLYAAAAGWLIHELVAKVWRRFSAVLTEARVMTAAAVVLLALLWGGFGIGARYVLDHQPAEEVAAVRLTLATLDADDRLIARVSVRTPIAKYSALAHHVAPWPDAADDRAALALAHEEGIGYLLWDDDTGAPPLADLSARRVAGTDRYGLYRLVAP